MFENHSAIIVTLGGLALFMYGLSLASDALQKLAANRTRDFITQLSTRPVLGVFLGMVLTLMIQSSGAVISMLVGLGSARVISLRQVMTVIVGAAVGSTFTVQLISFNISHYGLPMFALAFPVYFLTNKRTIKNVMSVIMGFGLLFWGLEIIGMGTSYLREVELFRVVLQELSYNPIYTILLTAFFTAIVHSSAVVIGFAMSLAGSGLLSLEDAIYWVYGANIGTTAIALIASAGGNYIGRQVAWAHCFYKIGSVLVFLPLAPLVASWLGGQEWLLSATIERDVANVHTLLNVVAALVFFPFVQSGASLIERFFAPSKSDQEFSVKYLRRGDYQSPSVALAYAERELFRMGDIVVSMIKDSLSLFKDQDLDLEESIRGRDDRVDLLTREINLYLTQQMEGAESINQSHMIRLISFAADLESAADVIDNNLLDMARKKHNLKLEFSEEGWEELRSIHRSVLELAELSLSSFQRQDRDLAAKVIYQKRQIRKQENKLREAHFERLAQKRPESINTSSIHIDLLGEYRRLSGLLSNHVYGLLKESDRYNLLPRSQ